MARQLSVKPPEIAKLSPKLSSGGFKLSHDQSTFMWEKLHYSANISVNVDVEGI